MIGICPKCGDKVVEGESSFFCRSNDCVFKIGKTILEQPIDSVQASMLLNNRRSDILNGFVSKSGKKFPAYLVMDGNGKITFEFPDREPESEEEPEKNKPRPPETLECKPLINAATRNLYRNNAFRITGLTVDATNREIAKHVGKLKMLAELGQTQTATKSAFALDPPPTTDDIREAIQKLKDPELRVIDEFFWFWPEEFGNGENDPALMAVARGELQTALEIWMNRERHPSEGGLARHNLWVYSQMMAIEHEAELAKPDTNGAKRHETDAHWQKAIKFFAGLSTDDRHWEILERKIRALDDARLTSDFAWQIKATLPKALARIYAELALVHVQQGNTSRANMHVRFARETVAKNEADQIMQALLASNKSRVQELARQAKENSEHDPENANKALIRLIETVRPFLETFDSFLGNENYFRNDLFDEVAGACTDCAVDYQKKTGDNQVFLMLLENSLPFAASPEMKQRINKNITIAQNNIAGKKLQPIYEKLSRITNGDFAPLTKLKRINDEVVVDFGYYTAGAQFPTESINELSDSIAAALRSISIDLHNEHSDTDSALEAIDQAIRLAKDQEHLKRLNDDRNQLQKLKKEKDSHNLLLSIRDDQIEMTAKNFRYNSTNLPIDKITGIKFGIFTQYTNGVKSSVSYTIGIQSSGHGTIEIECKRFFRSEDQAKKDFEAILDSCFYRVIPDLVTRLAKQIAGGYDLPMGDSWITSKGIRATIGILMWKEEIMVPWSDVRFGVHQGHLNLSSNQNKKFSKSYALRDTWNAVIFEQITKAFFKLRDK